MRTAAAAGYEAHPAHHLDALDDETWLAGAPRHSRPSQPSGEAAAPLGEVGGLDRRDGLRCRRAIKKVEPELILAAHRAPAGQGRRRPRRDRLTQQGVLGGVGGEAASSKEIRDRVIDGHTDHEFRHATIQAFIEKMVEQRRPIVEAIEVGAETEIEDLPGVRPQCGGLRLDESLDGVPARVFHHVDVVRRRRNGQDGGKGAVQEEPQPRRRELALERGAFRLAHLLAVERLDGRQVLQLRRTDLERHRVPPLNDRKY